MKNLECTIDFSPEARDLMERFIAAASVLGAKPADFVVPTVTGPEEALAANPSLCAAATETPFPEDPAPASQLTVADLRRRVVSLVSNGKKDEVREIVKSYADSVTNIPPEKFDEFWARLDVLEGVA